MARVFRNVSAGRELSYELWIMNYGLELQVVS